MFFSDTIKSIKEWLAELKRRRNPTPDPVPDPDPPAPPRIWIAELTLRVYYGDDKTQQFLALYVPAHWSDELVPVVIMVHGGGWRRGDADADNVVTNKVSWLLPQGIALASVSYRLGTDSKPPVSVWTEATDVAAAIAYLRANAKTWGIDPNRMGGMGHSAGAHLITLTNCHPQLRTTAGDLLFVIPLDSAVYNVPRAMQLQHPSLYDAAFGTDLAYQIQCSPYDQLDGKRCPYYIVASTERGPENIAQSNAFNKKLLSYIGGVSQVHLEELEHGAINKNLGLPGPYTDGVTQFMLPYFQKPTV